MNSTRYSLILILALALGCNSATESTLDAFPIKASLQSNGVTFTLSLFRQTFNLLDSIEGRFQISNESGVLKRFDFGNLQQLGFRLTDDSGNTALFQPLVVLPATSSLQLRNGESKEYNILTVFKDHMGNNIAPKEYTLAAFLLNNNSPEVSLKITVK